MNRNEDVCHANSKNLKKMFLSKGHHLLFNIIQLLLFENTTIFLNTKKKNRKTIKFRAVKRLHFFSGSVLGSD